VEFRVAEMLILTTQSSANLSRSCACLFAPLWPVSRPLFATQTDVWPLLAVRIRSVGSGDAPPTGRVRRWRHPVPAPDGWPSLV